MTTSPFEPHPRFGEERIAAADPGPGAPERVPGFGVEESELVEAVEPDED